MHSDSKFSSPLHSLRRACPWALAGCVFALSLGAAACGGSKKQAETPAGDEAESTGEPGDGDAGAGADDGWGTEDESDGADADEETSDDEPEQNAKSILIREGTAFMLDSEKSDMGVEAKEKCEKKHGEDVAKNAQCVSKALSKMPREGFLFDRDDDGNWWYVRFGIVNNAKVDYNKVQIEIGEPEGNKITVKPIGRDKAGARRGAVPKELNFEVPDEYTVVLQDPKRGRLEFEPKLGLFKDSQ